MAEAVAAWKALVRDRVTEAAGCCARAHGLLADVLGELAASPMHAADAWDGRCRALLADDMLTEASSGLGVSASLMSAAELIALRGVAPTPTEPLPSVDDVGGDERDLRFALVQLQEATASAEDACDSVELCRGHLWSASLLLDHPRLPSVDSFLDAALVAARGDLDSARGLAKESTSLARTALRRLR